MASSRAVNIACTIASSVALRRVVNAIELEGARGLALTRAAVLDATKTGAIDGLIYDLEPGDATSTIFVKMVHDARPDWPLLLYHAPRLALIERVVESALFEGVWSTPQVLGPAHDAELRIHIQRLLTSAPRLRPSKLLSDMFRTLPSDVRRFLESSLERSASADIGRPRVGEGVAGVRAQVRQLERACQQAMLPPPKRLLDHLLIVRLTFKSLLFGMPLAAVAEQAGLSHKALRELWRRALGTDARIARLDARAGFEIAFMALARACRVPQALAEKVAQKAASEGRR
jgi:hypothetical protein